MENDSSSIRKIERSIRKTIEGSSPRPKQIGPYTILDELGKGGWGTVYLAEGVVPGRLVALKVINPDRDSDEVVSRFRHELKALARMNHDAVAKVFDADVNEEQQPYFVMEYVEDGQPLDEYCEVHELDLRARLQLLQTVCEGVQHLHERGVVHGDLTPRNVLVVEQGNEHKPKVIDFGLARVLEAETDVGVLGNGAGTLGYIAPEQVVSEVSVRTDIYALGVMLYQVLTGRLPAVGTVLSADLAARAKVLQVTPRALRRDAKEDLTWITGKAMDKNPAERYESVGDLAKDLQRFLANEVVAAAPPDPLITYRLSKLLRRRPRLAAAALVLFVGLVASGVGGLRGAAKARAAEANGLMTSAQLAQERGDWQQALDFFAGAEAKGYANKVKVTIGRFMAHVGAFNDEAASAELRRLDHLSIPKAQQGRVLLLRGAFANRAANPAAGLDLVKEALRFDLPASERELANYLLAKTFDEARAAIERAVKNDPHDRIANLAMLSLLFCSGHVDDAVSFGEKLTALYPRDPITQVPQFLQAVLAGDTDAAKVTAQILANGNEGFDAAASKLAGMTPTHAACDDLLVRFVFDGDDFGFKESLGMAVQAATCCVTQFQQVGAGNARVLDTLGSVVPPCVSSGFRGSLRLLPTALRIPGKPGSQGEDARIRAVVREAADQTGLAVFRFMSGYLYSMTGEHARAVAEYERAARAGVLIPVPRAIDRGLLASSYRLWLTRHHAAHHGDRALAALARLLPHVSSRAAFEEFLQIAADLDDSRAVASVVAAWRRHPKLGSEAGEPVIASALKQELDRHAGQPIARYLETCMAPVKH